MTRHLKSFCLIAMSGLTLLACSCRSTAPMGGASIEMVAHTSAPVVKQAVGRQSSNSADQTGATNRSNTSQTNTAAESNATDQKSTETYDTAPADSAVVQAAAFAALPSEAYTGHPSDRYTLPGLVAPHMQRAIAGEAFVTDGDQTHQFSQTPDQKIIAAIDAVKPNATGTLPPAYNGPPPMPVMFATPWSPPGIGGSWPEDEYIFDGGDHNGGVKVRDDWSLEGLDEEDTIIHYDTLDGRTVVKPSNRVCIYAPRFAAVRKVASAYGDNQLVRAGGVDMPIGPVQDDKIQPVSTTVQPIQPVAEIGERSPITFLEKVPPINMIANTVIRAAIDRLKPYEDFELIRAGKIEEEEKPFIAQAVQAAITWTLDQGVQVAIEGRKASVLEGDRRAQATYFVETGKPCLRICKVASTPSALPGEIVEFTIRFDNIGQQTIGNVTLVDDLTTRLEYMEGTAAASIDAEFFTDPNPQGSLVLRWEIKQPMKPGEGGIARFKCKVR